MAKRKTGKKKPAKKKGDAFEALIAELQAGTPRPAYLLHGDDQALTRDRARRLIEAGIPESARAMNLWEVMGPSQDTADLVGKLKTPSLMPGLVAVVWYDANLFQGGKRGKTDFEPELQRIDELWADDEHKPAAQIFLALSAEGGLGADELAPDRFDSRSWLETLGLDADTRGAGCLAEVAAYCSESGLQPRSAGAAAATLDEGIAAGFPPGNFLVLTTKRVLRGADLYKRIDKHGAVISCAPVLDSQRSVEAALEELNRLCQDQGLELPRATLAALAERVGANPGLLAQELAKVAAFADDQGRVSAAEVRNLVQHSREDPIWELSRAVTERDLERALVEVDERLRRGTPPLMLLGALANQWRRLAWARSVADSEPGMDPNRGSQRNQFGERVKAWVKETGSRVGKSFVGQRKPYGVWMLFDQSFNYQLSELERGFLLLRESDRALKGSRQRPAEVLTGLVIDLLGNPNRH